MQIAEMLKLRIYPDPILRKKAREVKAAGEEERRLLEEMPETMRENQGIGLAAPQVGVSKRIIVVADENGLLKMINPKILSKKGTSSFEEGCLSVPGTTVYIERPDEISVSYIDEGNQRNARKFKGLTARIIQHEINHLDGKLILDHLPWYKRIGLKI